MGYLMNVQNVNQTGKIFTWVIVVAVLVFLFLVIKWIISTFNDFKNKMEEVYQSKSGIDIQLEARFDTLKKLKDTVQGYVKHENQTFTEVTKIRRGMSVKDMAAAEQEMQTAIREINAVAEQYPELKASQNFLMLQNSIVSSEKELSVARRIYNSAVAGLNKKISNFPSCLIAPMANAQRQDFFEVSAGKSNDVDMTF